MSMLRKLRDRRSRSDDTDDAGLLSVVMMLIIVGMGLAAVMTPLVVTQSASTSHTDTRVQALHEAEAGVNALLGRVRNATATGDIAGQASLLPCYDPRTSAPLSWRLSGSSATGYDASMQYYTADPLKFPSSLISCAAVANGTVPSFAAITSVGKNGTGSQHFERTLVSVYSFETDDTYSPTPTVLTGNGGQLRFNPVGSVAQPQCIDAGLLPVTGTTLLLQPCASPASYGQLFYYNSDLSLQLARSISTQAPYGLCVDSVSPSSAVSLQPCKSAGGAAYDSQWSLDDNSAFGQTRLDNSRVCLNVPVGHTDVQARSCLAGYDATASWLPTPTVGTGAAGAADGQLVNLSQFGRCAQATNSSVPSSSTNPFVLYPCEQKTTASAVGWYQGLAFDASTGHWTMTKPGDPQSYCLTSPGAVNQYVSIAACSAVNQLQSWSDNGAAAADQAAAPQWAYATRYTITDHSGLCLSLSPTSGTGADWYTPAGTNRQYSKIIVATCDGSAQQKWNANPDPKSSMLKSTTEH